MAKRKFVRNSFFFPLSLFDFGPNWIGTNSIFLNLSQSRNSHGFAAAPVKLPSPSASPRIEMGKAVNGTETLGGKMLHILKIPGPDADLPGPVATSPQVPVLLALRNITEPGFGLGQTNLKLRSVKWDNWCCMKWCFLWGDLVSLQSFWLALIRALPLPARMRLNWAFTSSSKHFILRKAGVRSEKWEGKIIKAFVGLS